MNIDHELLHVSKEAIELLDKQADNLLPKEIVSVVKTHSKMAVASSWIPIPGADLAAGAASIWGMYIRINNKIDLPFADNIIKSIGSGVATNLAGYIAVSGVASALKFIPVVGQIGGAVVMSAAQYALTLASGYVYLKALSFAAGRSGGTSISGSDLKAAIDEVLGEKGFIKRFIEQAKKDY